MLHRRRRSEPRIDTTIVALVALTLAGAGGLTALTKYNVPAANRTYLGTNLFAVKSDAIGGVMGWLFGFMALAGAVVQAHAFVRKPRHRRLYKPKTYAG